jgi:signal peptide peptidase SppA
MNRAYSRAGIMARLFNQPLAVRPETAAIVLGAIGQRFDVQQLFVATEGRTLQLGELEQLAANKLIEIGASGGVDRKARMMPAERLMFVSNGVAHVPIRGETVSENGIGPSSGFTGYDGIVAQVQAADADPAVRGILLDVDSPGGEVSGMLEAAQILMARRGTKPMRAMIRGVGASAAYCIASCADDVTLHDLGLAGSIGCISMHADFSGSLEQDGIKVTLFASGAHKADGNPFEPLPADVVERVQSMVDTSASRFIDHVATARGLAADAVRGQEAQIFMGEAAVTAGLVDKIMSWQDSMDEFETAVNDPGRAGSGRNAPTGARASKGLKMEITQEQHDAALAAAASAARAEGVTEGTTAGATAERGRITALAEIGGATLPEALTAAIADGVEPGAFAVTLAKAAKDTTAAAAEAGKREAVDPAALPGASVAGAGGGPAPQVNRGAAAVDRLRGKVPGLPAKA